MATRARSGKSAGTYFLRFAGTAGLLMSGTLVLVLYVLPERYVLSSGFREGSQNFPNPSTPFQAMDPRLVAALPPPLSDGVVQGPAELFWPQVLPLLLAERWEDAIPLLAFYLVDNPGDVGARREYVITLTKAGYRDRAIPILEQFLGSGEDREIRLLLARTLRDEGRVSEASEHYRVLVEETPAEESLVLEWAQALAWMNNTESAKQVLVEGLKNSPESVPLRVELARLHYYTDALDPTEDLEAADAILSGMTEAELASAGALTLRDDVRTALTPPPDPEVEPPPPLTTLELAIGAREDGDFDRARGLFETALLDSPDDVDAWQAYADFLQYQVDDFEGALEALKEVERLQSGDDVQLQYRMTQLEVWAERTDAASARLEAILVLLESEVQATAVDSEDGLPPVTKADVLSQLGDLRRWEGERLPAVDRYEAALVEDPEHARAREGLALLQGDVDRMMIEVEEPHLGAISNSFADTDNYRRLDLGGDWYGIHEDWVWGTKTGARWLQGFDATGAEDTQQGLFANLEGARWWRWGTVRTAVRLGVQNIRANQVDAGAGISVRLMGGSGRRTDVGFDHEPAYGLTNTLQSMAANVRQDRFTAAHGQPISEAWSIAGTFEAASLDHRDVAGADRNTRIGGGLSVGRTMSSRFSLGFSARVVRYSDDAPEAGGIPLYWDPNLSVSLGPYLQYRQPLGTWWEFNARVNPAFAYIDERRTSAVESAPDLSANIGLVREGANYRTLIELFYGQGQFRSYRSMGINIAFSARGWLGRGGGGGSQ